MKIATLCYLTDKNSKKILLGKKKYGSAKGKLNGFGGKVEEKDKTIKAAIKREFKEETGLSLINPRLRCLLIFKTFDEWFPVYVYFCNKYKGRVSESDEMTVTWYKKDSINFDEMWPSDQIWFPIVSKFKNAIIELKFKKGENLPMEINILFNKKLYENIHKDIK